MGVLIHHSFAAYVFQVTGRWSWSESPVLNQLGQSTVAMFFMITGFLFSIKAADRQINWQSFYIGRLARLAPLYVVFVAIVVLLVLYQSAWRLMVSPAEFVQQVLRWLIFVCFGRPDINGFRDTWILVAGVNWSLAYEVYFYVVGVPILHFGYRMLGWVGMSNLICCLVAALLLCRGVGWLQGGNSLYASQFLFGAFVAYVRDFVVWDRRWGRAILVVGAVGAILVLGVKLHSHDVTAILCAGLLLLASVKGVSVFGLLRLPAVVWLGEVSYGVYLLHGIVLVSVLGYLASFGGLSGFGWVSLSAVVSAVAAVVVLLSTLSYRFLERPVMRIAKLRFGRAGT